LVVFAVVGFGVKGLVAGLLALCGLVVYVLCASFGVACSAGWYKVVCGVVSACVVFD
jgi:hypothetical protein